VEEEKLLGIVTVHSDLLYWALAASTKKDSQYRVEPKAP